MPYGALACSRLWSNTSAVAGAHVCQAKLRNADFTELISQNVVRGQYQRRRQTVKVNHFHEDRASLHYSVAGHKSLPFDWKGKRKVRPKGAANRFDQRRRNWVPNQ
jgi:hypothetical protein